MKKATIFIVLLSTIALNVYSQATYKLKDVTLMHEMRATPNPLNNAIVKDRFVSLQWPLAADNAFVDSGLDGLEEKNHKKPDVNKINYQIRLSQDSTFQQDVITADCSWAFYNPEKDLVAGTWFWQYGYVRGDNTRWSRLLKFDVVENPYKFAPPSYSQFIKKLPTSHPRVLVFKEEWNQFITQNVNAEETSWYLTRANEILSEQIFDLNTDINVSKLDEMDNEMKRISYLTRESRRIVDKEEANTEVLIRSYVLTKNDSYLQSAMDRIEQMISWKTSEYFKGDFNQATVLSLASMAYDSFYDKLSEQQKKSLLTEIKENGTKIFNGFANHLENHIADNHNWQMNLRIFSMAAYSVYGDLPEAEKWTDYTYNIWKARFPGLNEDGGWHNGDSYFQVNIRTLIEVPYFYTKVTGYDFFSDPWYVGSAYYTIYHQPPFSKSAGNGSAHLRVQRPGGARVGYADALAKLIKHPFLASYAAIIQKADPVILKKAFMAKPSDLAWFRLQYKEPLPPTSPLGLLPLAYVFPQTGIGSFMSNWSDWKKNAMFSFRSSPYGSTSHAIANQNAFNTFYGGKSLFYSSGHHIEFTDVHSVYCHRATRAHNTILVNGMGQRIGTEGYGWIPRYYVGDKVSYMVGDASNAYGNVISSLWQKRGEVSKVEYTPENGWDKNRLKTFRRHVVELGDAGLVFMYDELEADTLVTWDYLLHTVAEPMKVSEKKDYVHIRASNDVGVSNAYLMSADKLEVEQTDKFFVPAINWLRADDKGNFEAYDSHWHFKAASPKRDTYRFATIIHTHNKIDRPASPKFVSDDTIEVGDWKIRMNLKSTGKPYFVVEHKKEDIKIIYNNTTRISEQGKMIVLTDELPNLEI